MGGSIVGKNKDDMYMEENEMEIIQPQESTVEEYDMRLERMEEEVKKLKKIRKRQKKLNELEFEQREILKKMEKNTRKNR
jgi:predicted RNase H-like nuclease (RuvC/YqgF family)